MESKKNITFLDFLNMVADDMEKIAKEFDKKSKDENVVEVESPVRSDVSEKSSVENDVYACKYPSEPVISRHLFMIFMSNLLSHIKFDSVLYTTTSGTIDLRNSHYYETDMAHVLKVAMDDQEGYIGDFINTNKSRLEQGGNVSDADAVDALYNILCYDYRQRRVKERMGCK